MTAGTPSMSANASATGDSSASRMKVAAKTAVASQTGCRVQPIPERGVRRVGMGTG